MKLLRSLAVLCVMALGLHTQESYAWGKDGHCLVGSVAAQLLAAEGRSAFKTHRFDLCYYNNVPDLIWKAPATYDQERIEHFFNLEPVLAQLKKDGQKLSDLPTDRALLDDTKIQPAWGRAPWRIQELSDELDRLAKELKKKGPNHQTLQAEWLLKAGVMGHYVADLAQPLHCTENYDGQLTDQKGLHRHFETMAVSELLPDLESKALRKASAGLKKFSAEQGKKPVFQMSLELCKSSMEQVPTVLKMDKKVGRKNKDKFVRASQDLLVERVALGALYLAEIWRRQADWEYDGDKFFFFSGEPKYIPAGKKSSEPN